MTDNINSIKELVAAYLLGDLETDERAAFKARLENEPELRQELEFQQTVKEAHEMAQHRRDFKEKMQAARQADVAEPPRLKPVISRFWRMAALFLVAFLAGWILKGLFPSPTPKEELRSPVSPPVAQPGEEEGDILVGAGKSSLKMKLRFVRIAEETDYLDVLLVKDKVKKAVVKGNVIALHFPAEEMPDENSMRLVEWMREGERVLYLRIGEKAFRLGEGEQGLVEEREEEVLRVLRAVD